MTLIVLGILSFTVIVLLMGCVLIAVTFSRTLQRVADHADRVHDRSVDQLSDVLDRLTARDLGEYKTYALGDREHGTVSYPEGTGDAWNVPGVFLPGAGVMGGTVDVGRDSEGGDDL